MNQNLKSCVYGKGTMRQAMFMARIGGMNEEETNVFISLHKGKPDNVIMDELGLDRKTFKRIEGAVRSKLIIALFECINAHMRELQE